MAGATRLARSIASFPCRDTCPPGQCDSSLRPFDLICSSITRSLFTTRTRILSRSLLVMSRPRTYCPPARMRQPAGLGQKGRTFPGPGRGSAAQPSQAGSSALVAARRTPPTLTRPSSTERHGYVHRHSSSHSKRSPKPRARCSSSVSLPSSWTIIHPPCILQTPVAPMNEARNWVGATAAAYADSPCGEAAYAVKLLEQRSRGSLLLFGRTTSSCN